MTSKERRPSGPGPRSWWVTAWAAQGLMIVALDWALTGAPPLSASALLRIHLIGALAAIPLIVLYRRLARLGGAAPASSGGG